MERDVFPAVLLEKGVYTLFFLEIATCVNTNRAGISSTRMTRTRSAITPNATWPGSWKHRTVPSKNQCYKGRGGGGQLYVPYIHTKNNVVCLQRSPHHHLCWECEGNGGDSSRCGLEERRGVAPDSRQPARHTHDHCVTWQIGQTRTLTIIMIHSQ